MSYGGNAPHQQLSTRRPSTSLQGVGFSAEAVQPRTQHSASCRLPSSSLSCGQRMPTAAISDLLAAASVQHRPAGRQAAAMRPRRGSNRAQTAAESAISSPMWTVSSRYRPHAGWTPSCFALARFLPFPTAAFCPSPAFKDLLHISIARDLLALFVSESLLRKPCSSLQDAKPQAQCA